MRSHSRRGADRNKEGRGRRSRDGRREEEIRVERKALVKGTGTRAGRERRVKAVFGIFVCVSW